MYRSSAAIARIDEPRHMVVSPSFVRTASATRAADYLGQTHDRWGRQLLREGRHDRQRDGDGQMEPERDGK